LRDQSTLPPPNTDRRLPLAPPPSRRPSPQADPFFQTPFNLIPFIPLVTHCNNKRGARFFCCSVCPKRLLVPKIYCNISGTKLGVNSILHHLLNQGQLGLRGTQPEKDKFPLPLGTGSYIRDQNPSGCASHFRQQLSRKHLFSPPNYSASAEPLCLPKLAVCKLVIQLIREVNTLDPGVE
jgi:hypothetical protein